MPRPAGLSGTAVSSEPMSATNTAPDRPSETSVEAERLDDEEQAEPLGHPDQDGQETELGQMPRDERPEHAFLEPVVQLEDLVRQRQRDDDPAPEVAHREQREGEDGDDDDADPEHDLDGRREAAPEAPVAGGEPEQWRSRTGRGTRSMKTVPNVRDSDAVLLILSRYAR